MRATFFSFFYAKRRRTIDKALSKEKKGSLNPCRVVAVAASTINDCCSFYYFARALDT